MISEPPSEGPLFFIPVASVNSSFEFWYPLKMSKIPHIFEK
jgi:hypothetical protein